MLWCDLIIVYIVVITIIYPFTVRILGAPQMTSQPISSIFPCSPLPSGTWRTPGLCIPWCCLPTSFSVCLVFFSPFTVPCKMVLARPDKQETWPYHCSLHLFTMVRRSSCGLIACWILAWTSSLVTWCLYEMHTYNIQQRTHVQHTHAHHLSDSLSFPPLWMQYTRQGFKNPSK